MNVVTPVGLCGGCGNNHVGYSRCGLCDGCRNTFFRWTALVDVVRNQVAFVMDIVNTENRLCDG
jgi:hypothetical protein